MRALLTLSLGMLLLSSCGRVFCVGPFGPIDECYAEAQSSDTTSTVLAIARPTNLTAPKAIPASTPITLTAQAGTAPYSWQVISSSGAAGTLSGTGTSPIFTGNTVTYTPPSTTGTTTVQLTDANSQTAVDALVTQ